MTRLDATEFAVLKEDRRALGSASYFVLWMGRQMVKNICIFSDGTGQMGGARPDQRLSNVYKMYRAMRPGPDSPISPKEQVAFYDPGLGTGESGGLYGRFKPILESAVGTGLCLLYTSR